MSKKLLETIKAVDGKALHLFYHQARYENSLTALGAKAKFDLEELLSPPKEGIYRCRILYDENEIDISYHPYVFTPVNSLQAVYVDELEYSLKYADRRSLDELFVQKGECDDILIVKKGIVTDTSKANVAFFDGSSWVTPKNPLLKGTSRARYMNEKKLLEKEIHIEDIKSFEKAAVLNAMVDFHIFKINGIIL